VISGPASQPGWIGTRFMGEAMLPLLSPDLMKKCPVCVPRDLERHTFLHSATRRRAWSQWLSAAGIPDLKPVNEQVFEHFYFAIQAALGGLGVVVGPLSLVAEEVRDGRLLIPIGEPTLKARGYFVHVPVAGSDAPSVVTLRKWLADAGRTTEAQFPTYLAPPYLA
jgi:LysR family glycine cleavage system transcriptional activator